VKFAFIQTEKAELGVGQLCRALGVSRAGFYAWHRRASAHDAQDELLKVLVREAHQLGRGYYGSPRVHRALKKRNVPCSTGASPRTRPTSAGSTHPLGSSRRTSRRAVTAYQRAPSGAHACRFAYCAPEETLVAYQR